MSERQTQTVDHMLIRAIVGIAITVVLLAFALKRGWFPVSLTVSAGRPRSAE